MEPNSAASRTATLAHLSEPDHLTGTPAAFQSDMADHTQSWNQLDANLRTLLRALPTRADIEALPTRADIESLILQIEEAHSRDIQEVRTVLHSVSDRVTSGETLVAALETRVQALDRASDSHIVEAQLNLEEMEDRSRRNNLRLWGLPEATGPEDLAETVTAIFHSLLDSPPPSLEIDRVHRTLGPKSTDPSRPRDVLCRLH